MINIIPTQKALDNKETIERDTGLVLINGKLEKPRVVDCRQYKLDMYFPDLDMSFMEIFNHD